MIQNTRYKKQDIRYKGFTLIEALTFLFIFSLIMLSFYNVISLGTRYIQTSKNRLGAVALANEKMEIIRNLVYDDVGIISGACEGSIPSDEDVTENGKSYHVRTLATYVDDPFDGTLGGSPNDTAYKDYKIVKITVSWGAQCPGECVFLESRFSPLGLESATSGDGILSINVISDQTGGASVAQTSVHIVNDELGFNENRQTDNSGNVMIVGAKESINKYEISLEKSGYETVLTMPPFPDTAYNPADVHASVIAGSFNNVNFIQNKTADLQILTMDNYSNPVANINFNLKGGRRLGNQAIAPFDPVYNLNASSNTDSNGGKIFSDISPGQYSFSLDSTDYVLIGTDPPLPLSLVSEQELTLKAKLASHTATSLLVKVTNSADGSLVSGAEVKIRHESGHEESIVTDANGTAFFPIVSADPLFLEGNYSLTITADGFNGNSTTAGVNLNQLTEKNVSLEAN